jgi:hypothetical protein
MGAAPVAEIVCPRTSRGGCENEFSNFMARPLVAMQGTKLKVAQYQPNICHWSVRQ